MLLRRGCEARRCLFTVPTESDAYLQANSALRRGEEKRAAAARKETHARWLTTAMTGRTDLRLLRLLLRHLEEGLSASRDRHNNIVQGDDQARPRFQNRMRYKSIVDVDTRELAASGSCIDITGNNTSRHVRQHVPRLTRRKLTIIPSSSLETKSSLDRMCYTRASKGLPKAPMQGAQSDAPFKGSQR